MKTISKSIVFFLNSSIFIAICAFFLSLSTYKFFEIEPNLGILFLIFFSTVSVYNLARVFPLYLDKNTDLIHKNWFFEQKKILFIFTVLPLIPILFYSFKLRKEELLYLSHLAFLSVMYSFPKYKPLRTLPYLKIFLITYVWSSVCVGLPILNIGFQNYFTLPILLLFTSIFLFIFAIAILFDIRDKEEDLRQNIKTLPHKIGEKKMLYISVIMLVVSSSISIFLKPENILFENIFFILTTLIILKSKEERSNWYYLGLLDSTIILKSLVFILY